MNVTIASVLTIAAFSFKTGPLAKRYLKHLRTSKMFSKWPRWQVQCWNTPNEMRTRDISVVLVKWQANWAQFHGSATCSCQIMRSSSPFSAYCASAKLLQAPNFCTCCVSKKKYLEHVHQVFFLMALESFSTQPRFENKMADMVPITGGNCHTEMHLV